GCTHYSFLVPQIRGAIGPDVRVIDPAPAVARQALRLLPGPVRSDGHTVYLTTGDPAVFSARIRELRGVAIDPTHVTISEPATIGDAVDALRAGLVVGVPTDTVYGIGVDPRNPDAVTALAGLKGRASDRPFPVLAASIDQALTLGAFNDAARRLAADHWPGPLTLVVTATSVVPGAEGTIGLRVPDHPTALALLETAGPLAVTSANLSGDEETRDDRQARAIFGGKVAVYLEGRSRGGIASTVIDCTAASPVILRAGPVG
ncbi:MAG: L-threonylcarbamoyladenylate synthase, partial [Acidimicrobiia bacterium]